MKHSTYALLLQFPRSLRVISIALWKYRNQRELKIRNTKVRKRINGLDRSDAAYIYDQSALLFALCSLIRAPCLWSRSLAVELVELHKAQRKLMTDWLRFWIRRRDESFWWFFVEWILLGSMTSLVCFTEFVFTWALASRTILVGHTTVSPLCSQIWVKIQFIPWQSLGNVELMNLFPTETPF